LPELQKQNENISSVLNISFVLRFDCQQRRLASNHILENNYAMQCCHLFLSVTRT